MSEFSLRTFILFTVVFVGVFTMLHLWVYRSLIGVLPNRSPWNSRLLRRCLTIAFIVLDSPWLYFYYYRFTKNPIIPLMVWIYRYPFAIWQSVMLFWGIVLIIYTPLKKTVIATKHSWKKVFSKSGVPALPTDVSRRRFIRVSAVGLTGYAVVTSTASVIGSEDSYDVNERRIPIRNLPAAFDGFTIGLMSDIHSGMFQDKRFMEKYAVLLNNLRCDMIVLPGDYINTLNREIYPFAEVFSTLRAPSGVFGCTGNHDYFADADLICRESEQAGIRMLRNENIALHRNGETLYLLGIDDNIIEGNAPKHYVQTGKNEHIEAMFRGVPGDAVKILLCHRPYPFEEFAQAGVSLMLSGHTHGGQVALANFGNWNLSFASLVSPYVQGHYRSANHPDAHMYVSRGIGSVGLPIRVNCPPEVTKIVLVKIS